MRSVELSNGSTVEVRPMTVNEVRDGKHYGFGPMSWRGTDENFNDACIYCVTTQFDPDGELGDLTAADMRRLFKAILDETYSDPGEEKNSPTSGPGAQTKGESKDAESV